jgi:hypothetical protein
MLGIKPGKGIKRLTHHDQRRLGQMADADAVL